MIPASPTIPQSDLVHSLSVALHTTPLMSRVYDPDHVLSDETARQLVESLKRVGITMTVAAQEPQPLAVAP